MEFAPHSKIERVADLVELLFSQVLKDEAPLFISDEATLLDVSAAPVDDLLAKCRSHFGDFVEASDLRLPLWESLQRFENLRQRGTESTRS